MPVYILYALMAYNVRKTEHSGAKYGRGAHWGTKYEAKQGSKKLRRRSWKLELKRNAARDT